MSATSLLRRAITSNLPKQASQALVKTLRHQSTSPAFEEPAPSLLEDAAEAVQAVEYHASGFVRRTSQSFFENAAIIEESVASTVKPHSLVRRASKSFMDSMYQTNAGMALVDSAITFHHVNTKYKVLERASLAQPFITHTTGKVVHALAEGVQVGASDGGELIISGLLGVGLLTAVACDQEPKDIDSVVVNDTRNQKPEEEVLLSAAAVVANQSVKAEKDRENATTPPEAEQHDAGMDSSITEYPKENTLRAMLQTFLRTVNADDEGSNSKIIGCENNPVDDNLTPDFARKVYMMSLSPAEKSVLSMVVCDVAVARALFFDHEKENESLVENNSTSTSVDTPQQECCIIGGLAICSLVS